MNPHPLYGWKKPDPPYGKMPNTKSTQKKQGRPTVADQVAAKLDTFYMRVKSLHSEHSRKLHARLDYAENKTDEMLADLAKLKGTMFILAGGFIGLLAVIVFLLVI